MADSFSSLGYKLLARKPCFAASKPLPSGYYLIPGTSESLKSGQGADFTGKPPSGIFPGSRIRYSAYMETLPMQTDGNQEAANLSVLATTLTSGLVIPILSVDFQRSYAVFAVTFFEALDVIDSTSFTSTKNGIKVPNIVFKPIYAGASPLIPAGDKNGPAYWMAVAPFLPGNLSNGTGISPDSPIDLKNYRRANSSDKNFSDFSDTIQVGDGAKYVTYVAATKLLFRDVIYMNGATSTTGVSYIGITNNITNKTTINPGTVYVVRYAWAKVREVEKIPVYNWRISESFGLKPKAVATSLKGIPAISNDVPNHYFYDLNDIVENEVEGSYPPTINKMGYTLSDATALSDPTSPYYKKKMQFKIPGQDFTAETVQQSVLVADSVQFYPEAEPDIVSGLGANCDLPTSIFVGSQNIGTANQSFVYTSPAFTDSYGSSTRIGAEYYASYQTSGLTSSAAFVLVARTKALGGLSCAPDPCVIASTVFDITPLSVGSIITERSFDETRWTVPIEPLPKPQNGSFLLGEFPYRTMGGPSLAPPQEQIKITTTGGTLSYDQNYLPTKISLKVVKGEVAKGTFKLYEGSSSGKTALELAMDSTPNDQSGDLNVPIPMVAYKSFSTGGGFDGINTLWGAKKNTQMLGKLTPTETKLTAPWIAYSDKQVANIPAMMFPVSSQSVGSISNCISGYVVIAYETDGRIDLAFKSNLFGGVLIIRDVVLRVPDDKATKTNTQNYPPATSPFLFIDPTTKMLLLFYLYKDKLLVKKIPEEILKQVFLDPQTKNSDPSTEADTIRTLHGLGSFMVFDGMQEGTQASIAKDLEIGSIKIIPDPNPVVQAKGNTEFVSQYCAFIDNAGYPYAVVQTNKRMIFRRSSSSGEGWTNVFPQDFSFYPAKRKVVDNVVQVTASTSTPDPNDISRPQGPFVICDWATQNCILFMLIDRALLLIKFPVELLRRDQTSAADIMKTFLSPKFMYGTLTQDMALRGITSARSVNKSADPTSVLSQRVTSLITQAGYYRVFFKDDQGNLKSLISMDLGDTWMTDDEYSAKK